MDKQFTVKLKNTKEKIEQQIQCSSYKDLLSKIEEKFKFEQKKIKIMKPLIKDQPSFEKYVEAKKGSIVEILFTGQKKLVDQEMIKKKQIIKKKQQEAQKKHKDPILLILQKLKKDGIKQRPLIYLNQDQELQESFCDQLSAILYLMSAMSDLKFVGLSPDFRGPQQLYEDQSEKVLIVEYINAVRNFQGESGEFGCPLDWAATVLVFCQDYFDFPYPIFPFDHLIKRIFQTVRGAFHKGVVQRERQQKKKEPNLNGQRYFEDLFKNGGQNYLGKGFKFAGVQIVMEVVPDKNISEGKRLYPNKIMDIKKLSKHERMKYLEFSKIYYGFPTNFSKDPPHKYHLRFLDGFDKYFRRADSYLRRMNKLISYEEKKKNPKFKYEEYDTAQKRLRINEIPQFLFVPINRSGHAPYVHEYQKNIFTDVLRLPEREKSKNLLPFQQFIDLNPLVSDDMRKRLLRGQYWRETWFANIIECPGFKVFLKQNKSQSPTKELLYKYFDLFLLGETNEYEKQANQRYQKTESENLFHQFYFGQENNTFQTADYRFIGAVYHRGQYFHNLRVDHLKDEQQRKKLMKKAQQSIYFALKIGRGYERQSEDDSTDEENQKRKKQEEKKRQQNLRRLENIDEIQKEVEEQRKRYEKQINEGTQSESDYENKEEDNESEAIFEDNDDQEQFDSCPQDKERYIHNCRGDFQTIVYRKGREWMKIFGNTIERTTIEEAMNRDKWGDGEWTPLLLLYKQISFPPLRPQ